MKHPRENTTRSRCRLLRTAMTRKRRWKSRPRKRKRKNPLRLPRRRRRGKRNEYADEFRTAHRSGRGLRREPAVGPRKIARQTAGRESALPAATAEPAFHFQRADFFRRYLSQ